MSSCSPMDATTNGEEHEIIELDAADADPLAGGDATAGSRGSSNMTIPDDAFQSTSPKGAGNAKSGDQPSVSITPLARQHEGSAAPLSSAQAEAKQEDVKPSYVICEICDGYIQDLNQLRIHLQRIHKVNINPKMIHKPALNCQKCQFRCFTYQGLERHLLGSHGLVIPSMQDAAKKGQDSGRCSLCGKVYQWRLLAHVAKDHGVTLKSVNIYYTCIVCGEKFGTYQLFESHVHSAHRVARNAPRGNNPQAGRPAVEQPMANSAQGLRKGSLTISPQAANRANRAVRGQRDDEGIEIITIDDSPERNERSMENGEFKNRLPISDSALRKRNLEISVCGTDDSSDESHSRGLAEKRICLN